VFVPLNVEDIEWSPEGIRVTIRKSKNDQEGNPARPARCGEKKEGPIFCGVRTGGHVGAERLTHQSVAMLAKASADRIGFDGSKFGGHSLRALATSASIQNASLTKIMEITRHKAIRTVQCCSNGTSDPSSFLRIARRRDRSNPGYRT
jgi:hypothetical protein